MKSFFHLFIFSSTLLFSCSSGKVSWPEPSDESKPWTFWWWMGNAVDQKNIKRELKEMSDAGIGGVRIVSIYGVKGEEKRFIEYQSPKFSEILKFTIDEAHKLGMGVDLPFSAGWANGGPFVPKEKGLLSLRIHSFELKAGETWKLFDEIVNAVAFSFVSEDEKVTILKSREPFVAPFSGKVFVAELVKTGDHVKNPSPGGEGLAIDPYSKETVSWYLEEFWKRLKIDKGLIRCFYHDSFEYKGDITLNFREEFKRRRKYDFAEYLHVLTGDCHDKEVVARVGSDYRETLSDMLLESFIQPMTKWANDHQSLVTNQAHGSPGNILDIYAAGDIPETEIFGPTDQGTVAIFTNKFASSAAHVTGQKLVSSESYTWLDEHWTVTTSEMVRATNRLFLSGVNHLFFHGTCYSPEDAEWPGWVYYASTQVNNRNPLWCELPALFKYIERSQAILQQATPQNDLLVYWPFYDVAASEYSRYNYTNIDKGDNAPWFKDFPVKVLSEKLMDTGYTFDYISDRQLLDCRILNGKIVTSKGMIYGAVVVPKTKYMPVETMQQLKKIITEGGKVFFDEHLPESVPGMFQWAIREQKTEEIKKLISHYWIGDVVELLSKSDVLNEKSLSAKGFHFIKMKMDDENWYMVFNCKTESVDEWVELSFPAKSYLFLNPMNGEINRAQKKGNSIRIQLEPEQAFFIKCSEKNVNVPRYTYVDSNAEAGEIKGIWKITFVEGGPVCPGDITTQRLVSWTSLGDRETGRFAGTACYSIEFKWNEKAHSALLNLGDVKDCASVELNGKALGSLLGPSYKLKVDNLVPGKNILEVEVTNVAANRIRDYDIRGVIWKKFYRRNGDFSNIDYGQFDASNWEIRDAGLMGPVTILPLQQKKSGSKFNVFPLIHMDI